MWRTVPTTCRPRPIRRGHGWAGHELVPEAADDRVEWSYDHVDSAWHVAFTPGIRALRVVNGEGEVLLDDGRPTRVDVDEVRAQRPSRRRRLHALL